MRYPRKSDYNSLLILVEKHKWLFNRKEELSDLIEFCKDKSEFDLINELLNRFLFLYPGKRVECWEIMANQIFHTWNLDHKDTQIVAMAKDEKADSSQAVLQMLKSPIRKITGRNATTKNTITASIESIETKPCIVMVDEFIGSGTTVRDRIEYLRTKIDKKQIISDIRNKIKIYICVVAAMEHSLSNFEDLSDGVFAVNYLKKGISGYYQNPQLTEKLNIMIQMESRLAYPPGSKYFPFGYKQSEALYGTDEWNAVNNLFPVFWWEILKSGEKRIPLFVRG
jgi:hypothetical protein